MKKRKEKYNKKFFILDKLEENRSQSEKKKFLKKRKDG
jgi:hypothetical protein